MPGTGEGQEIRRTTFQISVPLKFRCHSTQLPAAPNGPLLRPRPLPPITRAMDHAQDRDRPIVIRQPIRNDVRQARYRPFIGPAHPPRMAGREHSQRPAAVSPIRRATRSAGSSAAIWLICRRRSASALSAHATRRVTPCASAPRQSLRRSGPSPRHDPSRGRPPRRPVPAGCRR